jgi:hypothetical protein
LYGWLVGLAGLVGWLDGQLVVCWFAGWPPTKHAKLSNQPANQQIPTGLVGWMVVGWAGRLVGWSVSWLVVWLVGWQSTKHAKLSNQPTN